jgi:hypothetical protein
VDRLDLSSRGFEIFLEFPTSESHDVWRSRTFEIEVLHTVRNKRMLKLSMIRDAYGYVACCLACWDVLVKSGEN